MCPEPSHPSHNKWVLLPGFDEMPPTQKSLQGLGILPAHSPFWYTHRKEAPHYSLLSPFPLVPPSPPPPPSIFNHPTQTRGCCSYSKAQRQRACPVRTNLFLSHQATHRGNPGRAEDRPAPLSDRFQEAQRSSPNTRADSILKHWIMVQRAENSRADRFPSLGASGCR